MVIYLKILAKPNEVEEIPKDRQDEAKEIQPKTPGKVICNERELRNRSLLKKPDRYACAYLSTVEPLTPRL